MTKLSEKEVLRVQVEDQKLTLDNIKFFNLAKEVSDYIKKFKPTSVIDYGCGTGAYAEVLRQNGLNVLAQDISRPARDFCKQTYPHLKVIENPIKSELMLFIEVAEHMTDEEIEKAISAIDPKFILFSSTPKKTDNDEAWGHINIKNESEWITLFESMGYKLIAYPKTPTPYAIMFEKQ